jgi:ribose transport system ATP-binding protein
MGSGRSETARILFGLDPYQQGTIRVDGRPLEHPTPQAAMERGIAFLTEDRRIEGLLMEGAIADNIALPSLPRYAAGWSRLIERTRLGGDVDRMGREVTINARDFITTLAKNLSGGNQQKVVIGKWLLHGPRLFIMDEPTRGIDVGAKYEVYKIIDSLAAEGAGVLMISSEIEELIGMCDRIVVMSHGEVRSEYNRSQFDREAILRAAMWDNVKAGVAA